jgi:hypothetical protein
VVTIKVKVALVSGVRRESMAGSADSQAGIYLTGTTRHLPAGRDYGYFCDAVADLYVGIRPDKPDGRFDADFALYRLGDTSLGFLSTPPVPASRDRRSLRQLPDDAVFVNFSRAAWTLDHLGTASAVPAASAFVIDKRAAVPDRVRSIPADAVVFAAHRPGRSRPGHRRHDQPGRRDGDIVRTRSAPVRADEPARHHDRHRGDRNGVADGSGGR